MTTDAAMSSRPATIHRRAGRTRRSGVIVGATLPHVLYLHRFAFVGEGRVAGDDKQAGDLGEVTGEHFGEAVAEILLLGVSTHIDEGQHDDGGLVGQGQRSGRGLRD